MTWITFIAVVIFSMLISLILGTFCILRQKGIGKIQAFVLSVFILWVPILIIKSHVLLYVNRHKEFRSYRKDMNLTRKEFQYIKSILDKKEFKQQLMLSCLQRFLNPKKEFVFFINLALEADEYAKTCSLKDSVHESTDLYTYYFGSVIQNLKLGH